MPTTIPTLLAFYVLISAIEADNLLNGTRNALDPLLDHGLGQVIPRPKPPTSCFFPGARWAVFGCFLFQEHPTGFDRVEVGRVARPKESLYLKKVVENSLH